MLGVGPELGNTKMHEAETLICRNPLPAGRPESTAAQKAMGMQRGAPIPVHPEKAL